MSEKLQKILKEKGPIKKIGVIGMGYVGIPAAALFADAPCFDHVLVSRELHLLQDTR
jgi:UDP-N-acetyl-D-mannosaminuronic acid dehydrogenase